MQGWPDSCIDSCVTDPPYELGFMGKSWDNTGIAYSVPMWKEVLRVLKPGGHLLSFGGTRTYHRMACAIEDAGFEIRDQIQWLYGSGFPKSLDVSKAIDKAAGVERKVVRSKIGLPGYSLKHQGIGGILAGRADGSLDNSEGECAITEPATELAKQWDGWGTALKPANEPVVVARKPLSEKTVAANVLKWGTGAMNIDACRIGIGTGVKTSGYIPNRKNAVYGEGMGGGEWDNSKGRWPANVIHDGSDEVLDCFPNAPGQIADSIEDGKEQGNKIYGAMKRGGPHHVPRAEENKSASRFFYCPKVSQKERNAGCDLSDVSVSDYRPNDDGQQGLQSRLHGATEKRGNHHPTVKPISLMSYLIRLVTPKDGVVLDPFMGSGSTGCAAVQSGEFNYLGCEMNPEYVEIAEKRILAVGLESIL